MYAKKDIAAGTVVAYYNGIRMKAGEDSPYDDTGYAIFVDWNRDSKNGHKKGEHMDLPPKVKCFKGEQAYHCVCSTTVTTPTGQLLPTK